MERFTSSKVVVDKKRKANVLDDGGTKTPNSKTSGHANGNGTNGGRRDTASPDTVQPAEVTAAAAAATAPAPAPANGDADVIDVDAANSEEEYEELEEESEDVRVVQKKWQMCSCIHFFTIFKDVIPLQVVAPATAGALEPLVLERAVGDPGADAMLSVVYRDVIMSLLAALKELPMKTPAAAIERWFGVLTRVVAGRPQDFPDCFDGVVGEPGSSLLERAEGDGMGFIYSVRWQCRLGLLHSLCDIVSEEAECVREVVKEAERLSSASRQEIEARHYRLVSLGRCSKKRFYYCIGGQRIYSGLRRKGTGTMVVECSDVASMRRMVHALESCDDAKDAALGSKIRKWYLGPLQEHEERKRRKVDRDLAVEVQREESRRRNADRPRRARASYM